MSVSLMSFPRRGQNPYLEGLYGALGRQGIDVFEDSRFFRQTLAKNRPTFVHYHWPENAYGHHLAFRQPDRAAWFFGKLALQRACGATVLWTFHNALPHENNFRALNLWARRRMVAESDVILVHFESARTHLVEHYGRAHDVWLVPHGSYRGLYPDDVSRRLARQNLSLSRDDFVFLLFGDLRPYKNIELAISAFRRIAAPSARLLIAGPTRRDDYTRALRALCNTDPRILLHDRAIPDERVQDYFRAADVLVLPREVFSSGTAVLSFDFGLPVLGPRVNHLAELAHGEACFDLPEVNEDALVTGFMRLLSADLTRARLDAARSTRHLAWDHVAARLARKLRRHVGRRRTHA